MVPEFDFHGAEVHGLLDVLPVRGEVLAVDWLQERPAILMLHHLCQHGPGNHRTHSQTG